MSKFLEGCACVLVCVGGSCVGVCVCVGVCRCVCVVVCVGGSCVGGGVCGGVCRGVMYQAVLSHPMTHHSVLQVGALCCHTSRMSH